MAELIGWVGDWIDGRQSYTQKSCEEIIQSVGEVYSECTSISNRETELVTDMYVEGRPITEHLRFEHFSALHPSVHGKT